MLGNNTLRLHEVLVMAAQAPCADANFAVLAIYVYSSLLDIYKPTGPGMTL